MHLAFRPLGDFVCERGCDCGYGGFRQGFKNSGHCISPVDSLSQVAYDDEFTYMSQFRISRMTQPLRKTYIKKSLLARG